MKSEIEAKIEFQNTIGEANKGGFQPVRFSRIKYKSCGNAHIDIRQYQRASRDDGGVDFFPTKKGIRIKESEFEKVIGGYVLTPNSYIHPLIIKKSFPLLSSVQYDVAVFQAFKIIETKIREKIGAGNDEYGVQLIRKAYHPDNGPLSNFDLPKTEREAFCNYIAGAFGFYKNPCSHREIEMDYLTAFSRIVVASDLLTIIDKSA
jgi:uncharacterized protein (TIGR02391 family)